STGQNVSDSRELFANTAAPQERPAPQQTVVATSRNPPIDTKDKGVNSGQSRPYSDPSMMAAPAKEAEEEEEEANHNEDIEMALGGDAEGNEGEEKELEEKRTGI
ncbi:hypothetical protein ACHAO1_011306, partial [Botrytis cinerea]